MCIVYFFWAFYIFICSAIMAMYMYMHTCICVCAPVCTLSLFYTTCAHFVRVPCTHYIA